MKKAVKQMLHGFLMDNGQLTMDNCGTADLRSAVILFLANGSVFGFIGFDAVPDQYEDLTVGRAALIVGNHVEFIQHLLINSDGYTLDSHISTTFWIDYASILHLKPLTVGNMDAKYIQFMFIGGYHGKL